MLNRRRLQHTERARIEHHLTLTRLGELTERDVNLLTRSLLYALSGKKAAIIEGLIASPGAGLSVDLSAPASIVQNIGDGVLTNDVKLCTDENTDGSDFNVVLATADPTNPRIDIIEGTIKVRSAFTDTAVGVVDPLTKSVSPQTRDRDYELYLDIQRITGTPAGSPTPPATTAATAGSLVSTVAIPTTIDLSTEYILNIALGKDGEYTEIDCRGGTPSATTAIEIRNAINAALPGSPASIDGGNHIVVTAPGTGELSIVKFKQPTDPTLDAYAIIMGGTISVQYFDFFEGTNAYFKIAEIYVPALATSLTAGNIRSREEKDTLWDSDSSTIINSITYQAHRDSLPMDHVAGSVDYSHLSASAITQLTSIISSLGTNYRGTNAQVYPGLDIGITWTIRTSAADNNWRGIAYGNGIFVAVSISGTGNRVMTSPDGITWTIRTSAADNQWTSVTYGNGLFVAVSITGTGNRVMTSPDGITWTIRTSAADNQWFGVTYGNGLFVAVSQTGTGNRVMTSPDGITWTIRTSAADNEWREVVYGNGLFVAVSQTGTGNRVMTSPDGITWTIRTSAADNEWRGIAYGNGIFVAVSISGTGNRVMTSPDGITWTIRTSAADNQWTSVTYGNGLFVAVSITGTGNQVMTSPDGITWTIRTSAADNQWFGVTYGNGLFVAVSQTGTGNRVMTSELTYLTGTVFKHDEPLVTASFVTQLDTDFEQVYPVNRVDQRQDDFSGGSTYAVPVNLSEAAGDKWAFTPGTLVSSGSNYYTIQAESGNHSRVGVYLKNGASSSGYTHLEIDIHDGADVLMGSAQIPLADIQAVNVGWIYVDLAATLTPLTAYHYHFHLIGESAPTTIQLGLDTTNTFLTYREMYLPTSGKYGGANEPDVAKLLFSTGDPVVPINNSGDDTIVTPGDGFIGVSTGTNYDFMPVDFSDDEFWNAWRYEDYIGVDRSTGRIKLPPAINTKMLFAEFNIFENISDLDTKHFILHKPVEQEETVSLEDYLDDKLDPLVTIEGSRISHNARFDGSDFRYLSDDEAYQYDFVTRKTFKGIAGLKGNIVTFNQLDGLPEMAIDNWTNQTSAADNQWTSVTYGNGLFVAVATTGTGNRVMTSPDGITWTIRTSAADNQWFGVTYGNGLFVAVSISGTGNRVMTSPDGITWTIRTSAADNSWLDVTYGNGLFVAVATTGTGNRVMTSPDGITWTIRTSAADNQWTSVTYGNGLFVAVAITGTGNRVMTSPDGITWTIRTSAADNGWREVVYGNGLFVAVSQNGTGNRVMTSPDGITWTIRTSAADNQWYGVTYGNGLFVAVAITGTGNRVMTSPDGITWTIRTSAADNDWRGIAYGNGLFVAVSQTGTGNRVMTSLRFVGE